MLEAAGNHRSRPSVAEAVAVCQAERGVANLRGSRLSEALGFGAEPLAAIGPQLLKCHFGSHYPQ